MGGYDPRKGGSTPFLLCKSKLCMANPSMDDNSVSIITLPNLKTIDNKELSTKNIHTGNSPNINSFVRLLRNPEVAPELSRVVYKK